MIILYFNSCNGMFENIETGSLYNVKAIQGLRRLGFNIDLVYP